METDKSLKVCGSITKKESLAQISGNILEHTVIAEADYPYSNYYGKVPDKPEPNSIFLFTNRYYTLEEALRLTQNIDVCAENKVNVASAVFHFQNQRHPAIRIRNFPDYERLKMLQQCYIEQGVTFSRKVKIEKQAKVTVNKCFFLEDAGNGFYMDKKEKNEGYLTVPKHFELPEFDELMQKVWNNSDCLFFDAAPGGFIMDGRVVDIIRVYSGHLDINLLKCIQSVVFKWM